MHPNNNNYSSEVPAHIAAKGVPPMPGDGNEVGAEHERLAANVCGPHATAPTGYISDGVFDGKAPQNDVFGSGSEWYGDHWDKGFAGEGDPYGIQSEYVAQSASPNAALPTQAQADAVEAQAEAEREERANEIPDIEHIDS
jgi:hypothetical protein